MKSARRPVSLLAAAFLFPLLASCASSDTEPFDVVEANISEMQQAMAEGHLTSRELVEAHLLRIALYEEDVNADIATGKAGHAAMAEHDGDNGDGAQAVDERHVSREGNRLPGRALVADRRITSNVMQFSAPAFRSDRLPRQDIK